MPRAVRNFWADLHIDGRSPVGSGPRAKDGGFSGTIFVRHRGDVVRALRLSGYAMSDGRLRLEVAPSHEARECSDMTVTHDPTDGGIVVTSVR